MPYKSISDLPSSVKGSLPEHAQEIYRGAFNSSYNTDSDDIKASRIAWGAVKRVYEKVDGEWIKKQE